MSAIDRIRREILTFTTARVNDKKQKSLKDERFTLISNNCTGGVLQVAKAVGEGAVAGVEICKYLKTL